MYERRYVNKRIRRAAVAAGAGVSAIGITIFAIIAFMGDFVGTFTVSLDTANVGMALSDSSSFKWQDSFLHIDELPKFSETTYHDLPSDDVLDTEDSDFLTGANYIDGEITNLSYFKYTFFLKNVGDIDSAYRLQIKILENVPTKEQNPRYLDDTIRIMLYENDEFSEEHKKTVYAKRRLNAYERDGQEAIWNSPISVRENQVSPYLDFQGYAEIFESEDVVCTITNVDFIKGAVKRYTVVMWIEGNDESSSHLLPPPEGAKLKIGVNINAYENQ